MINLEVTLISGKTYLIKNNMANNIPDFIRNVLAPHGTMLKWWTVFAGEVIHTNHIERIRALSDEELEELRNPAPIIEGDEVIVPAEQESENLEGTESEDKNDSD